MMLRRFGPGMRATGASVWSNARSTPRAPSANRLEALTGNRRRGTPSGSMIPDLSWNLIYDTHGVRHGSRPLERRGGAEPEDCLICGRRPSDAHYLRFAQHRALGRKVSDEFTVPLCRGHHREVHRCGDESAWWSAAGIDPTVAAHALGLPAHPLPVASSKIGTSSTSAADPDQKSCEPRSGGQLMEL